MRIGIDARKIADFGIGTYIRGVLHALARLGGPETYVAFAPESARDALPPNVEHVILDAPHYSLRELVLLGRAIAKAKLDLFHAPHYVVPITRCPTVVTIHDLIHLHVAHRNPLKPLYARTMLRRAIRNSARVLTVSHAVKRELVAFGAPEGKVVVTPNGIDPIFEPAPAPPSPQRRYFLYAGNDKPHKNVELLVDAFERVRRDDPSLELVLVGGAFARFAHRATIAGFVSQQELATLYRGALALVLPSSHEGFGLPAAEAMACGTAVITSQAPALVEVTGDAALHVDVSSSDALADAMRALARDDARRRELASRGAKRAREFTWKRCAEATREVFRGV